MVLLSGQYYHGKWEWKSVGVWLCDVVDYTAPGILLARILEWVAVPFSQASSQPRDQTQVSCIAGRFFTNWASGKPKNTGVGSLSLFQGIFPTQESNGGLLHCRRFFTNWVTREAHITMEDYSSTWRRGNLRVILEKTKQLREQGNDQQELDICCHFPQWQIIHAKIKVNLFCYMLLYHSWSTSRNSSPEMWSSITMNNLILRKIFIIIMVR